MTHTYASLAEFHDFRRASGSIQTANEYDDARILGILASVSRRIDAYCNRGPSGFGPRTGTNRYIPDYSCLQLKDDLLTVTSVTALNVDGTNSRSIAATGYYAAPLNYAQKRELVETLDTFGGGFLDIVGVWGYSNSTIASTTTVASGLASDATVRTFVTSASPTLSPGQTLLIGTEQLYLSGLSATTATVVRGVNGTTAAVHANDSAIAVYQYPDEVKDTALRLALRRWKARDAGADGTDAAVSGITPQEGEDLLLRRGVGHLRIIPAG